jgi:hypothetical protein
VHTTATMPITYTEHCCHHYCLYYCTRRWIGLRKITYRDPLGRERQWEGCFRTTKKPGTVLDAVYIAAETQQQLVVVSQFRPAAGVHVLEFPAGLVVSADNVYACAYKNTVRKQAPLWRSNCTYLHCYYNFSTKFHFSVDAADTICHQSGNCCCRHIMSSMYDKVSTSNCAHSSSTLRTTCHCRF